MRSALTISPLKEVARLINSALPHEYRKANADGIKNGIELHKRRRFDLILSDLNLLRDGHSGDEYIEVIKYFKEANPLVKIVVLSPKNRFGKPSRRSKPLQTTI